MRGSANRQIVSSTARWNLVQSDAGSVGAQKRPVKNQQTGQGSNLKQLQRSLASAEQHLQQTYDPRLYQNIKHGIDLLRAQIARITGVDTGGIDLNSVPSSITDYVFAGSNDGDPWHSTAQINPGIEQSPISPTAQFQLYGTLRQKITKVSPPKNATPGGSLKHENDPRLRSNVIRTPNNPNGSTFPTGDVSHPTRGMVVEKDTRDDQYKGRYYLQGFTPGTHNLDLLYSAQAGVSTSDQPARGKHGQYKGGYRFNVSDTNQQ